jgi:hypothetical protein
LASKEVLDACDG